MDEIRKQLINTASLVNNKIYSLEDISQDQIFNANVVPNDKRLLFLKHCYDYVNELITEANSL